MANKSKFSRKDGGFYMSFDASKLIKKIEEAGGNIKPAIEAAARKSLPPVQRDFQAFAQAHRDEGDMEKSLIDPSQVVFIWGVKEKKRFVGKNVKGKQGFQGGSVQVVSAEDCLFFEYGFDLNQDGGLHALWLDIGTPNREPKYGIVKGTFFVYYTIERNLSNIHAMQKAELMKILEGLR